MDELDPKRYIKSAPRAPEGTIAVDTLIKGDGDLELDIGFGRGLSLFKRHEHSPESRIIGVEIKPKLSHWANERLEKHDITNVIVWAADIRTLLPRLAPDGVFARAFIHFPDPWWKKKHRKKRAVVTAPVLNDLGRVLQSEGELFVQTDVEDRAEDYFEEIAQSELFEAPQWVKENTFRSISNREVRAEEDEIPIYRIVARRR